MEGEDQHLRVAVSTSYGLTRVPTDSNEYKLTLSGHQNTTGATDRSCRGQSSALFSWSNIKQFIWRLYVLYCGCPSLTLSHSIIIPILFQSEELI